MQKKTITITSARERTTKNGTKIYEIQGNDGIWYSTFNQGTYQAYNQVGQTFEITYEVKNNTGRNGQVYTNYNLVDTVPTIQTQENYNQPVQQTTQQPQNQEVMNALRSLYDRINKLEDNILSRLDVATAVNFQEPIAINDTIEQNEGLPTEDPAPMPVDEDEVSEDIPF